VLPPLLIVEGSEFDPPLKVIILSLDDTLLPLLVRADVVILVEAVVPVVFGLLAWRLKGVRLFEYLMWLGVL
jgi:hypothetical protein